MAQNSLGIVDRLQVLLTGRAPEVVERVEAHVVPAHQDPAWVIGRKENPVATQILQLHAGQAVWTEEDFAKFAEESYRSNVYAYRAIVIISNAMAGLKWNLFKRSARGKRSEVDAHPILDLMRKPQPRKGGAAFIYEGEAFTLISGNNYIVGVGPKNGAPRELWNLRPDRVRVRAGTVSRPIDGYEYRATAGEPQFFEYERVLHVMEFNPLNDFYGMGPTKPTARSIDVDNDARKWTKSLLQNSANPSLMLLYKEGLTDHAFKRISEQFQTGWSGPSNAGKIKILEGDAQIEKSSWSPRDMEWESGSTRSAKEVAIGYGVAPELLGDSANKTYANQKEARKALYVENVVPRATIRRDELNAFFEQWYPGYELDLDLDAIEELREDRAILWQGLDASFANGTITRNENRVGKGYDEDTFDYYQVPLGVTPVEIGMSPLEVEEPVAEIPDPDADENAVDAPLDETPADDEKKGMRFVLKAFNLNTPTKRATYAKSIDMRRARWVKSIRVAARKRLREERKAIVNAVKNSRRVEDVESNAADAIEAQAPKWEKFLRNVYLTVGRDFARATLRGFKSDVLSFPMMKPGSTFETKAVSFVRKADADNEDLWSELVDKWLRNNAGKKIVGMTQADLKRVRRELADGMKKNESIADLAARIDEYLEPLYENRAESIARTETIPASNLAGQMAARATGLPLTKSWIATGDTRTRVDHLEAESGNQKIPIEDAYDVGGEKMMFPGDVSLGASAENTIQCRCSEGYDVAEEN